MKCYNCHGDLDQQANFCKYCGAPLKVASGTKTSNRKKVIGWIANCLVFAVIAAIAGNIIVRRIKIQKVTPEMLDYLVSTTDDTVELVEEYFDLYFSNHGLGSDLHDATDFSIDIETTENEILRESIYLRQVYGNYTQRKGWDSDKYEEYEAMYEAGYRYFCNVDSADYWVQIWDAYVRQGRRNLDGYRMWHNPEMLDDLFDVETVFDPARPTPVPSL